MQELFELLAEYNRKTNRELLDILAAQPAEPAGRPDSAYHGSMLCVPSHVQQEDVVWMQRFAQQLPELEPLERELPCYIAEGAEPLLKHTPYYRPGEGFAQTVPFQALSRIRRTVLACQVPPSLLGTSVQIQAQIERHEKADQNYIEQGIRLV